MTRPASFPASTVHRPDPLPADPRQETPHDRRAFIRKCGGCLAHLALMDAVGGARMRELFAAPRQVAVVQEVPWGRLERVAEGVWAMVSTPLENRRTLCNGGIVEGRDGVVMVEAFGSPAGATWMAEQARALTGRWPDQVVLTHHHGDHTTGLPGLRGEDPSTAFRATAVTRDITRTTAERAGDGPLLEALARVTLLPGGGPTRMDLGGRVLTIVPRAGHTASDVTVELDDPSVVFCGDLVWNRFFPNYVDAVPSRLTEAVRGLRRERSTAYVPGHGPNATPADLELYMELLDRVEAHARDAWQKGHTPEEAAEDFRLPDPLAEWFLFSEGYPERALAAWMREWDGEGGERLGEAPGIRT